MKKEEIYELLKKSALDLGAYKASVIDADKIVTDRAFRDMCASNACGMYGKCYMCPPDVGDIDELMAKIRNYRYALVYQSVTELEDSFDFEGMVAARKKMPAVALALRKVFAGVDGLDALHLSVGNCGVCPTCAKQSGEPCRAPDLALPSLEAYGIDVSKLASAAGMKYINGQNTVTYFGCVLFNLSN